MPDKSAEDRFVEAMREIVDEVHPASSLAQGQVRAAVEAFADAVCATLLEPEPFAHHCKYSHPDCRARLLKRVME